MNLAEFVSQISKEITAHGIGDASILNIREYSVIENGVSKRYYQIKLDNDRFIRIYV
ncbi:MAG: hypothetical protein IJK26_09470 [Clostridia bacterium]|nr:hypothetical protein [Clostridia bacterium]